MDREIFGVQMEIINNVVGCKMKFVGMLFFVVNFNFYTVSKAQSTYVITFLDAGNCKSFVGLAEFVDTVCKHNNIPHFYFLSGIHRNELKRYSLEIFGKIMDSTKVLEQNEIQSLNAGKVISNTVLFVLNGKIVRTRTLNEFSSLDIMVLKHQPSDSELKKYKRNVVSADSIMLQYGSKVKIDERIRLNKSCKFTKLDSFVYIFEPLFNHKIYKLNYKTGVISAELSLDSVVNPDSVIYYKYNIAQKNDLETYDSLKKFQSKFQNKRQGEWGDMFVSNSRIFLLGDYKIISFGKGNKMKMSNYGIACRLNLDLRLTDYFLDPYVSYSGFYPTVWSCINCSDTALQYQVVEDANHELTEKRIIYFNVSNNRHEMKKSDRTTFTIPLDFTGTFYSNVLGNFANLGTRRHEAWLLDPYPYIYFPDDSIYYDIIDDTLITHCNPLKENVEGNSIYQVKKLSEEVYAFVCFFKYKTLITFFNIKTKTCLKKDIFLISDKYNLLLMVDSDGKYYYVPKEKSASDSANYIYFE